MSLDEVFLMCIVTVICIITPSVMKFIRNSRMQDNIEYTVRPITSKYKAEVKPCMPKNGMQNVIIIDWKKSYLLVDSAGDECDSCLVLTSHHKTCDHHFRAKSSSSVLPYYTSGCVKMIYSTVAEKYATTVKPAEYFLCFVVESLTCRSERCTERFNWCEFKS